MYKVNQFLRSFFSLQKLRLIFNLSYSNCTQITQRSVHIWQSICHRKPPPLDVAKNTVHLEYCKFDFVDIDKYVYNTLLMLQISS